MSALSMPVDLDQYLHSSWKPDLEFIEGVLKEKPMPTKLHALVQAMLCLWFGMHMDQWSIVPLPEVRTRVGPQRFRLPDVAITRKGIISSRNQEEPPLIAIEILSSDDRFSDLRDRARDLQRMGVANIWLIDPETCSTFLWGGDEGAWIPTQRLIVDQSPVHLDLTWFWAKVGELTPDSPASAHEVVSEG
jgi:Uma2 family endonuclease